MEKKSMGSFLNALRKANGLTQKQLAEQLNVSDKAVSRWERDECAPDLSLIPVLAEIYGVTSDEILRGQRSDPEKLYHGNDRLKSQKQRNRILKSTKTSFISRSLITAAIALVGLILAYVFNFEFSKANTGFLLGSIFFITAGVCQINFLLSGLSAVTEDEWQDSGVSSCKGLMLTVSQWVLGGITTAFALCIPLAGKHTEPVAMAECLINGTKWVLITAAITLVVCLTANAILKRRGTVDLKLAINRLRVRCSTVLSLVIILLLGIQIVMNCFLTANRHLYAPHDVRETLPSFKNLMATPTSHEGYHMEERQKLPNGLYTYVVFDSYGTKTETYHFSEEEIIKQLLPSDAQPNPYDDPFSEEFGYQFKHLNRYIPYYEISNEEGILPIYTFNTEQLARADTILIYINLGYLGTYLLAAVATAIIYILRQKKV